MVYPSCRLCSIHEHHILFASNMSYRLFKIRKNERHDQYYDCGHTGHIFYAQNYVLRADKKIGFLKRSTLQGHNFC